MLYLQRYRFNPKIIHDAVLFDRLFGNSLVMIAHSIRLFGVYSELVYSYRSDRIIAILTELTTRLDVQLTELMAYFPYLF